MARKTIASPYSFFLKLFGRIEKRNRFIISAGLLTLLYTGATFFSFQEAWIVVPVIILVVFAMTFFAILEGISRHEWFTLFIHPIFFSVAVYLFYFFVPQRWLTRIPFVTIYVISIYAIMLSQNIFNVGVSKSLQLYRAAFSVNYLFLTISSFVAYSLIISLRLHFLLNIVGIFLISLPLAIHMLWTVEPKEYVPKKILSYGFLIALLLGEAGGVLSFMPMNQSIFALILTSLFYSLTGFFQIYMQGALYKERTREYVFVLGFALLVLILTLNW